MSGNSHQRKQIRKMLKNAGVQVPPNQPSDKPPKPKSERSRPTRVKFGLLKILGSSATVLGIITGVLFFFPKVSVSLPGRFDGSEGLSYYFIIENEGLLPIEDVTCSFVVADFRTNKNQRLQGHLGFRQPNGECYKARLAGDGRLTFNAAGFISVPEKDMVGADVTVQVDYLLLSCLHFQKRSRFKVVLNRSGKPLMVPAAES